MKRLSAVLSILLCLLLTLSSFVYATGNKYVSALCPQQIDEAVLDVLELAPTDKIVKIYNTSIDFAFSQYSTISDILDSEYEYQEYYAISHADGTIERITVNKWLVPVKLTDDAYFDERNLDTFFSGNVIKLVSQEIKVNNVYYFTGETNHEGFALYYQTDMGDYVYYEDNIGNDVRYLMPAAYFHEYMKAIARQHGPSNANGWHPDYRVAGYTHYDIRNADYDPNIPPSPPTPMYKTTGFIIFISISILLAAVSVCVIYRIRKRKE